MPTMTEEPAFQTFIAAFSHLWFAAHSIAHPPHERTREVGGSRPYLGKDNLLPSHVDNPEKVVILNRFSKIIPCERDDH
jgi:hypothetical protein